MKDAKCPQNLSPLILCTWQLDDPTERIEKVVTKSGVEQIRVWSANSTDQSLNTVMETKAAIAAAYHVARIPSAASC